MHVDSKREGERKDIQRHRESKDSSREDVDRFIM